jgi:hypothetical protein
VSMLPVRSSVRSEGAADDAAADDDVADDA